MDKKYFSEVCWLLRENVKIMLCLCWCQCFSFCWYSCCVYVHIDVMFMLILMFMLMLILMLYFFCYLCFCLCWYQFSIFHAYVDIDVVFLLLPMFMSMLILMFIKRKWCYVCNFIFFIKSWQGGLAPKDLETWALFQVVQNRRSRYKHPPWCLCLCWYSYFCTLLNTS